MKAFDIVQEVDQNRIRIFATLADLRKALLTLHLEKGPEVISAMRESAPDVCVVIELVGLVYEEKIYREAIWDVIDDVLDEPAVKLIKYVRECQDQGMVIKSYKTTTRWPRASVSTVGLNLLQLVYDGSEWKEVKKRGS